MVLPSGSTIQYSLTPNLAYRSRLMPTSRCPVEGERISTTRSGSPGDPGAAGAKRTRHGLRQVWSSAGSFGGTVSRDGQLISYTEWPSGRDIAVRNLETGENRQLTHKGSWTKGAAAMDTSSISPDGRYIAYQWARDMFSKYEIRLAAIDGSEDKLLYQNDKASYLEPHGWSPDGTRLAVTEYSGAKDPSRILLIERASGKLEALAPSEVPGVCDIFS